MKKTTVIRWIFTVALLCGVWTETGIWTTLCLFLIAVTDEITAIRQ